jgi:hypothetical protein
MMAAVSVVILYLGSFVEVLDMSVAVAASLIAAVIVIEYGAASAWSVYGVSAILSLLLLPQKFPAVMYAFFFGYYPIVKQKIERMRSRLVWWVLKSVIFVAATAAMVAFTLLFTPDAPVGILAVLFALLAFFTVFLYDVALTRVISFYVWRLRNRVKNIFK